MIRIVSNFDIKFRISLFGIVSDFDIRISDFVSVGSWRDKGNRQSVWLAN
jgi:hypothetical protein